MRTQLIQYVNLLFAGSPGAHEIREEILQNTLDRYDDLITQGKPEATAYSLAISGIGDINALLRDNTPPQQPAAPTAAEAAPQPFYLRLMRYIAIALYIISPAPLFVLSELDMSTIGLCGTLSIVAVATVLLLISKPPRGARNDGGLAPQNNLRSAIRTACWSIGLVIYIFVSFLTNAWHITWLIFPMAGCVSGLITAGLDYKEAV